MPHLAPSPGAYAYVLSYITRTAITNNAFRVEWMSFFTNNPPNENIEIGTNITFTHGFIFIACVRLLYRLLFIDFTIIILLNVCFCKYKN